MSSPRRAPARACYLLGLYLGDGHIASHPRGVFKLRLTLDAKYPALIDEAAAAMEAVSPANSVARRRRKGDVELYSYSKAWPCMFPQHGTGKKHRRRILLEPWQDALVRAHPHLLLRGLIQSDGCRFENTGRSWRHPRYVFSNLSADIRGLFSAACDELGLHWTPSNSRVPAVYMSRKRDVAILDRFVGPKS